MFRGQMVSVCWESADLTRWLLAACAVAVSCQEGLPPYEEPRRVLAGEMAAAYVLTPTDNSVKICVTVNNVFDESLEARAQLRGTVEIVMASNPDIRKSVRLTPSNIPHATGYDARIGVLRLDPGDSIQFGFWWDLVDDKGVDLRQAVYNMCRIPVAQTPCQNLE